MTTLHLVRHGQSTWNAEGRLQGQTAHPGLTDLGRRQAAAAAAALAGVGADALLTSDLRRAAETAAVIGRAVGVAPVPEPALREQALGAIEGRLTSSLTGQPTPAGLHVSQVRWGGPASESVADVHARVGAFLTRLLDDPPGEEVVLVSHGDTIRVALAWLRGRSARQVQWCELPNGSVTTVAAGGLFGAGQAGDEVPLDRAEPGR